MAIFHSYVKLPEGNLLICCFFLGCPSCLMMNLLQTADRQACQKVAKCESVKKAKDDGDEGLGMHSMLPLINWKSMETWCLRLYTSIYIYWSICALSICPSIYLISIYIYVSFFLSSLSFFLSFWISFWPSRSIHLSIHLSTYHLSFLNVLSFHPYLWSYMSYGHIVLWRSATA